MFSGPIITVAGTSYMAYPTTLSGVSLIIEHSSGRIGTAGSTLSIGQYYAPLKSNWNTPISTGTRNAGSAQYSHGTRYAFVKTGAIESGVATVSGAVARAGMDNLPSSTPAYIAQIHIKGSATFTVPTCRTPDVTVYLGKHTESDFPAVGSRRGYSGTYTDFDIDLTDCYAPASSVLYSLRPLNGAVAGTPGMMNLAAISTARGVGIRLTDRSGAPVTFNSNTRTTLVSGSRRILLRASMERTGVATFSVGSVAGHVEFTISYS